MKKIMKKDMKKKGFTLIELIAVIAILAILGAVLVPKISGYQDKAKKSNIQTSAKTMVHAMQAYNADATTTIGDASTVAAAVALVNGESAGLISTSNDSYTKLSALSVADLVGIANGKFTYHSGNYTLDDTAVTTAGSIAD